MSQLYVHGYDGIEAQRLQDQAASLVELLFADAGFGDVRMSPRMVYVDDSRPQLAEGFTRRTFSAMVRGVRGDAIAARLERTAQGGGVFCYTFCKAVAAGQGGGA